MQCNSRRVPQTGLLYPVLSSVLSEGNVLDAALVTKFVKLKEDAEADSCEGLMCGLWDDVVARKVAPAEEAAGDRPFLDEGARELDHAETVHFGDRDQAGACAKNGFLGCLAGANPRRQSVPLPFLRLTTMASASSSEQSGGTETARH